MPTTGRLSGVPPMLPKNCALPKVNTPPSAASSQYPPTPPLGWPRLRSRPEGCPTGRAVVMVHDLLLGQIPLAVVLTDGVAERTPLTHADAVTPSLAGDGETRPLVEVTVNRSELSPRSASNSVPGIVTLSPCRRSSCVDPPYRSRRVGRRRRRPMKPMNVPIWGHAASIAASLTDVVQWWLGLQAPGTHTASPSSGTAVKATAGWRSRCSRPTRRSTRSWRSCAAGHHHDLARRVVGGGHAGSRSRTRCPR